MGSGINNLQDAYEDMLGWSHNASLSLGVAANYERSFSGKTNGIEISGLPSIPGFSFQPVYTRNFWNSKGYKYK